MLNKVAAFVREHDMIRAGDSVICAVSGGADSVALLFALFLLKDKMHFSLSAAHFNHHLRGEDSNADEAFVRVFCDRYDIPLYVGEENVVAGCKGLEAAAREARYRFFEGLPGKIATAHTADDNAETVLMHLLRGTGLKGLGGISPVRGNIVRPMLTVTRADVEAFLDEYYLNHVEDGSNAGNDFLRNRIRHRVVPLLKAENPSFAAGVSDMALRLRQDEDFFQSQMMEEMPGVMELREMHQALRLRYLDRFLKENNIPEPEQSHLAAAERLVFSPKPSAAIDLPGGAVLSRKYDRLEVRTPITVPEPVEIPGEGCWEYPQWGVRILWEQAPVSGNGPDWITVDVRGRVILRSRESGDSMRLPGGTKSLKKVMIDQKIPAVQRPFVPILADDSGVLLAAGIGSNLNRKTEILPAVLLRMEKIEK